MAWTWRDIGSAVVKRGKQILPVPVSIGLVTFLIWQISPQKLAVAFTQSNWPWLVAATLAQLVLLFLWDSVCVWWLFRQPDRPLSFRSAMRHRCDTVIWSAFSLEIGQAAFAWRLSKVLNIPLANALSYIGLLALFDSFTLTTLAVAGSFIHPTPITSWLRWLPMAIAGGELVLMLSIKLLPERWRGWLMRKSWAYWMTWFDWRAAVKLWALRLVMFLGVLLYAGVGLAICRLPVDAYKVLGVIPFVLLAEGLPGTAGLGEREAALIYLYPGGETHRAVLLSFGLIWSTVVIAGRVAISLVSWCVPKRPIDQGRDESREKTALTTCRREC